MIDPKGNPAKVSEQSRWQRVARRIRVPIGFVFAAVFLLLANPTPGTLLESLLLVVPGLWLRAYASGYVNKNAELTTTGPYAYTRNPLYLGSMLIAFGFAGAAGSWPIAVTLAALFVGIYVPTIQGEEAYLRQHFAGFDAYARRVPRLLPRLTPAQPSRTDAGRFSAELWRRHREYNSLLGAGAIYLALLVRLVSEHHIMGLSTPSWWT